MRMPSVYPMTRSLHSFLRDTLMPVEAPVYEMFGSVHHLVRMVEQVEAGLRSRHSVNAALRQHNEDHDVQWSYEQLLNREGPPGMFLAHGEWALHTDRPDLIMRDCSKDIDEAVLASPDELSWAIYELPSLGVVFVMRSPFEGHREELSSEDALFCGGLYDGTTLAYTLPGYIEKQVLDDNPPLVERLFGIQETA